MFVCVARLTLQIPESGSLKAKRQVLRRVTERVKARFNVAVAEVEDQDLWQKASVGLAVIGNDRRHVDEQMEKIIHFVEEMYIAPLMNREKEILAFGDQLFSHEVPPASPRGDDEETEGEPEGLSPEELIASLNRRERSMAEAEGMAEWESRHDGRETEILGFGDQLFAGDPARREPSTRSPAASRVQEDWDEEDEDLSPEAAAAQSEAAIARFLRGEKASLAEAEGLGDWERRHLDEHGGKDVSGAMGRPSPSGGGRMSMDEARARARSLRNPRDWEKK